MALTDGVDSGGVDTAAFAAVCEAVPDRRVELLYGSIHVMNRPAGSHQHLLGRLYLWFSQTLGSAWLPLIEVEVLSRLDGQVHRMVPDLAVFSSAIDIDADFDITDARLVVEVLSPSTRDRDLGLKSTMYARSGIDWYWIVDPASETIEVRQLVDGVWTEPAEPWPGLVSFSDL